MSDVLQVLLDELRLERIEEHLFRGESRDLGWGRVFGGQVLGQALSAAEQTVPQERLAHSVHAYFLRPGDPKRPIVYTVDPIRDGRSFTTRRVVAIQGGRAILNLAASFHRAEEGPFHQDPMPEAPGPDGLPSAEELAQSWAARLPSPFRARAVARRPIEIRPIDPIDPLKPEAAPPRRTAWFRAAGRLPDDPRTHQYLLAYASDFHFLTTALQPHALSFMSPGVRMASLDHAMWFHQPFRADEWLLYEVDSPAAAGARGLVRGRFFTQDGRLVASTAQEGLLRRAPPPQE